MDIYDQYAREADRYLAAYGLRVAPEGLPAVREEARVALQDIGWAAGEYDAERFAAGLDDYYRAT